MISDQQAFNPEYARGSVIHSEMINEIYYNTFSDCDWDH